MRTKQTGRWIIPALLVILMLVVVAAIAATGADSRPIRRHLPRTLAVCPDGALCDQNPPTGPAFSTDRDPESEAALAEIHEVLMRRGCQIAVVERINEDGTRTPALQIERVWYFIAMP
jgi:hypothetical protein